MYRSSLLHYVCATCVCTHVCACACPKFPSDGKYSARPLFWWWRLACHVTRARTSTHSLSRVENDLTLSTVRGGTSKTVFETIGRGHECFNSYSSGINTQTTQQQLKKIIQSITGCIDEQIDSQSVAMCHDVCSKKRGKPGHHVAHQEDASVHSRRAK